MPLARLPLVALLLVPLACVFAGPVRAEAPYRSIVIFGDTQRLVDGAPGVGPITPLDPGDARELEALHGMIDWVRDQREEENIDFVLHVGDAIQSGTHDRIPVRPECYVDGKCLDRPSGPDGPSCGCRELDATAYEWRRFNQAWKRLDGVVPYAIVRGNHDNVGADRPGFDTPGFSTWYGEEAMRPLPGYLGSHREGEARAKARLKGMALDDRDVAHAWKFALGGRPLLVIGISDGAHQSSEQLAWARGLLEAPEHRDVPAILLAHRLFNGIPIDWERPTTAWLSLVEKHHNSIFMAVWGHVSPGDVRFIDAGKRRVLSVRSNWQGFRHHPAGSFMNVVRFWMNEDGIEWVEVVAISPTLGIDRSGALRSTRMRRTAFEVEWGGAEKP